MGDPIWFQYFNVEVNEIIAVKKGRKEKNLPRWFAIKLCQDLTGLNLQALVAIFNVQHYSAISKTVGRLNTLMVEDRKVKLQLEKLRDCLISESYLVSVLLVCQREVSSSAEVNSTILDF